MSNGEFKEEDIRPAALREQLDKILVRDVALWLKTREHWVGVNCPACNQNQDLQNFPIRDFPFSKCGICGTVFHNPRPTVEQLGEYYRQAESYSFWMQEMFPAGAEKRREFIARPLAQQVAQWAARNTTDNKLLLEVGSGSGLFLEEMQRTRAFKKLAGIEPTPALASALRNQGFQVHEKPFESCRFPDGYCDALCAFEVIEHLFDPREFLQSAYRILRPHGLLMLSCPNVRGFDFQVLGLEKAGNIGLEHINMFHPQSLENLLADCGFKVVESSTPGRLDADLVRTKILAGQLDISNQPFLERVLVHEWDRLGAPFQDFLRKNGLSSNMVLVAVRS